MKAILVLEDGFSLEAESFTGEINTSGQVVFHTAMLGYEEIITSPANAGQILCFTYPLIGNYGTNIHDMESEKIQIAALLCKEVCYTPSNWQSTCTLPDMLQKQGIPGLQNINTRRLTHHLRDFGPLRGVISTNNFDIADLQAKAANY